MRSFSSMSESTLGSAIEPTPRDCRSLKTFYTANAPTSTPCARSFRPLVLSIGAGDLRQTQWQKIKVVLLREIHSSRSHRNAATIFAFGTVLVIFVSAVGGYQAFHYTESTEFCGATCHDVMYPEYTAYKHSPHARVACVECHIGPGADWWVQSKLSGAYQVYAVIADVYPRPIPTPIENLRPAQETCEQCHWPQKFFGGQQKRFNHYMYDEANTPWPINMLIKTGGGNPRTGQAEGIHWHMNIKNNVEYIARDEERQEVANRSARPRALADAPQHRAPLRHRVQGAEQRVLEIGIRLEEPRDVLQIATHPLVVARLASEREQGARIAPGGR